MKLFELFEGDVTHVDFRKKEKVGSFKDKLAKTTKGVEQAFKDQAMIEKWVKEQIKEAQKNSGAYDSKFRSLIQKEYIDSVSPVDAIIHELSSSIYTKPEDLTKLEQLAVQLYSELKDDIKQVYMKELDDLEMIRHTVKDMDVPAPKYPLQAISTREHWITNAFNTMDAVE
jgi:hypothetical protein